MFFLLIGLKVLGCILVADFLSGFFHWLEDAYGREDWPITGTLITKPNILHHHDPRYFTNHSWLYSARVLLVMGTAVLGSAYAFGFLNWMTILVVMIGVNANEIHKWSHRTRSENGSVLNLLQRTGLIQSPKHHHGHHNNQKNTHYCVITNYLNPILDGIQLWPALERLIHRLFGLRRRLDSSLFPSNIAPMVAKDTHPYRHLAESEGRNEPYGGSAPTV